MELGRLERHIPFEQRRAGWYMYKTFAFTATHQEQSNAMESNGQAMPLLSK